MWDSEVLKKRADKSFAKTDQWRTILQECYRYYMPQRDVFSNYAPGQVKDTHLYDSTGVVALKEYANRMMGTITPQGTIWAQLEPGLNYPREVRFDEELREKLQEVNETLFGYINNSNFYTIMGEAYHDLGVGTAAMTVEEGDVDSPLVYGLMNQAEVGYEQGPTGLVENVFRKRKLEARNIERAYQGGQFSSETLRAVKDKPDSEISFLECMLFDPKGKNYWIVVIEEGKNQVVWEINRGPASPWIVFRWAVVHGEVRGRGPAMDAIHDVKTLNKVQEFALQKSALELAGLWTGQDDGVFNPYTVNVRPGVVVPVSTNLTSNPSLMRLDTGGPLQLTQFEFTKLQASIKQHLYNDLRDPTGPVRSATEVAVNQRELVQRIGSSFGRIQNEALVRILNSSMATLRRLGLVPNLRIDGRDIAVKFTSPLARAQDLEDIDRLAQSISMTAQLAGPEAVNATFRLDQVGQFISRKTGVDASLLRTDDEVQEMLQGMAQQQQAMQQQTMQ